MTRLPVHFKIPGYWVIMPSYNQFKPQVTVMRLGKGCGDEVSKRKCPNNSESSTLRAEGSDPLKEMSKIVVDNRSHQEMVTKLGLRNSHLCKSD